jgi:hypothetical protein
MAKTLALVPCGVNYVFASIAVHGEARVIGVLAT